MRKLRSPLRGLGAPLGGAYRGGIRHGAKWECETYSLLNPAFDYVNAFLYVVMRFVDVVHGAHLKEWSTGSLY